MLINLHQNKVHAQMVKLANDNYNSEYNTLSEKQDSLKLRVRLAAKQIGLNFSLMGDTPTPNSPWEPP